MTCKIVQFSAPFYKDDKYIIEAFVLQFSENYHEAKQVTYNTATTKHYECPVNVIFWVTPCEMSWNVFPNNTF